MLIKVHLLSLNCLENISLGLEIELGFALFYSRNQSKPIMAAVAGRIFGHLVHKTAHDVNKAASNSVVSGDRERAVRDGVRGVDRGRHL